MRSFMFSEFVAPERSPLLQRLQIAFTKLYTKNTHAIDLHLRAIDPYTVLLGLRVCDSHSSLTTPVLKHRQTKVDPG